MLFDPLEEQLHLPAAAIQLGDSQSRQGEVVGQKHQSLLGWLIEVTDAPELVGIIFLSVEAVKHNGLIAAKTAGFVHSVGILALEAEVFLGPCDKESRRLVDAV
jgi:hypothetical protein